MATTYNNLYMDIRQTLRRAGIEAATLEARELMCFASGKTRSQLVQDGQLYVPPAIEERAKDLVRRHLAGEPVAYLIGEWCRRLLQWLCQYPRHLRSRKLSFRLF